MLACFIIEAGNEESNKSTQLDIMKTLSTKTAVVIVTVIIALAFTSCSKGSTIVDPTKTHQDNGTN